MLVEQVGEQSQGENPQPGQDRSVIVPGQFEDEESKQQDAACQARQEVSPVRRGLSPCPKIASASFPGGEDAASSKFFGEKGKRAQQAAYQQIWYRRPEVLHVDDVQAEGEIQGFQCLVYFAHWLALVHQGLAVDDQAQAD